MYGAISAEPGFDFAGTSRFEVLSVLGKGAVGVVYEALDRERAAHVASGEACLRDLGIAAPDLWTDLLAPVGPEGSFDRRDIVRR
jgi:hypothetical protein